LWPETTIMIQSNGTNAKIAKDLDSYSKYHVGWGISVHRPEMRPALERQWGNLIDNTEFTPAAIIPQGDAFVVHQSNPITAFKACTMRHSHTVFKGKLYKCPVMAVLPEFCTQQSVIMDARQEQLLAQYQPLSVDCTEQQLTDFVDSRNQPIDQCEFCPGEFDFQPVVFHKRKK